VRSQSADGASAVSWIALGSRFEFVARRLRFDLVTVVLVKFSGWVVRNGLLEHDRLTPVGVDRSIARPTVSARSVDAALQPRRSRGNQQRACDQDVFVHRSDSLETRCQGDQGALALGGRIRCEPETEDESASEKSTLLSLIAT